MRRYLVLIIILIVLSSAVGLYFFNQFWIHRYDELIARRDTRTLMPEERQELLRLTDQVELLEAERMKHLIDLAKLRQVSLDEIMKQLGLPSLSYV